MAAVTERCVNLESSDADTNETGEDQAPADVALVAENTASNPTHPLPWGHPPAPSTPCFCLLSSASTLLTPFDRYNSTVSSASKEPTTPQTTSPSASFSGHLTRLVVPQNSVGSVGSGAGVEVRFN
ncbi:hypothetical protein ColTof3_14696 [Colletotrichum tofieldiae]|nr:hypothetical protein ColTof3_14696 [Colletotrichum tofieldiae]